jgi:rubrerythrin
MPTTTKDGVKLSTEEYLRELLGNAAVDAMKARGGLQGLCQDCVNREICRRGRRGETIMSCATHKVGPAIPARSFKTFEEVLDFARENEEKTAAFYLGLAKTVERRSTRATFKSFAKRSLKHRRKLERMKNNGRLTVAPENVQTLKITKYVTRDVQPGADLDTREALVLAIKTAGAAQNLYADLAAQADDARIQTWFAALAQEEAEQKLKLETEYDEHVLKQD